MYDCKMTVEKYANNALGTGLDGAPDPWHAHPNENHIQNRTFPDKTGHFSPMPKDLACPARRGVPDICGQQTPVKNVPKCPILSHLHCVENTKCPLQLPKSAVWNDYLLVAPMFGENREIKSPSKSGQKRTFFTDAKGLSMSATPRGGGHADMADTADIPPRCPKTSHFVPFCPMLFTHYAIRITQHTVASVRRFHHS